MIICLRIKKKGGREEEAISSLFLFSLIVLVTLYIIPNLTFVFLRCYDLEVCRGFLQLRLWWYRRWSSQPVKSEGISSVRGDSEQKLVVA